MTTASSISPYTEKCSRRLLSVVWYGKPPTNSLVHVVSFCCCWAAATWAACVACWTDGVVPATGELHATSPATNAASASGPTCISIVCSLRLNEISANGEEFREFNQLTHFWRKFPVSSSSSDFMRCASTKQLRGMQPLAWFDSKSLRNEKSQNLCSKSVSALIFRPHSSHPIRFPSNVQRNRPQKSQFNSFQGAKSNIYDVRLFEATPVRWLGGWFNSFYEFRSQCVPAQRNANQKQKGILILFKLNPRVTTFTTFPPKADQERVLLNFHLLFSSVPFALQLVAQLYELAVASVALVRVIVHVYSRTFYETRFIIWFPTHCSQKHFLSDLLISEERSVLDSVCVIRHPRGWWERLGGISIHRGRLPFVLF